MEENCIFCKIVNGTIPSYKIYEDEKHLAFLTPYPNTIGFSVVITKEHNPSYIFDNEDETIKGIMIASKKVAKLIDSKLEDVGRTGVIFEGFGIDHLHAKLFPMHGTKMDEWKNIKSNVDKFFDKYEGYISSHDYKKMDDNLLKEIADKIADKS
jgi:histidine triad (HIT) family protein